MSYTTDHLISKQTPADDFKLFNQHLSFHLLTDSGRRLNEMDKNKTLFWCDSVEFCDGASYSVCVLYLPPKYRNVLVSLSG